MYMTSGISLCLPGEFSFVRFWFVFFKCYHFIDFGEKLPGDRYTCNVANLRLGYQYIWPQESPRAYPANFRSFVSDSFFSSVTTLSTLAKSHREIDTHTEVAEKNATIFRYIGWSHLLTISPQTWYILRQQYGLLDVPLWWSLEVFSLNKNLHWKFLVKIGWAYLKCLILLDIWGTCFTSKSAFWQFE